MRRIDPFELLYANMLQCVGWNSADVITSGEKGQKYMHERPLNRQKREVMGKKKQLWGWWGEKHLEITKSTSSQQKPNYILQITSSFKYKLAGIKTNTYTQVVCLLSSEIATFPSKKQFKRLCRGLLRFQTEHITSPNDNEKIFTDIVQAKSRFDDSLKLIWLMTHHLSMITTSIIAHFLHNIW